MKKKGILLTTLALAAIIGTTTACSAQGKAQQNPPATEEAKQSAKQWDKPPAMQIDQNKTYIAHVETNKGKFSIELFAKDAPKTVNNFVFLSREKFYDGIVFHRIVKNFMIQAGDPLAKGSVQKLKDNPQIGSGSPGYRFEDELSSKYKYEKGIVAMANSGSNTNGSQFFIGNGSDVENLNSQPNYTIFGKIVDGMDTVDKISNTPVGPSMAGELSFPEEDTFIKTITIEEK
ncbi:peptidylprolyl isomerase [Aneurinibacillus migulanus]|uniref:Peptidyl-prolyl cis-trans isomerase n=1 Tax=Aneurinibacillus migulanus TaxID=47500 RepID=A0A0D1W0C3_ANEMI|nr:peptidylprolyl isomerase [Aneurinibacillus migulanus]KIV51935.1 peptidylprolyl isomerase [Aneurinibacillus migulanus]KON98056.1 peptidylprolyl isomerase [Aneurinibacillus migulanus]MED0891324.1 peptidylprolyl isomerase [Aneurinibacillus migulanus]MED1613987.1 peptidylprolyl isomerase [Aneurinibacillus migulanus]SDI02779.1 Peptidyl-prolyl cis-trans isomerase (rotamase)-cyclophilin family [Aneurinibacillus migulanus]